jgi:hypothetical protein
MMKRLDVRLMIALAAPLLVGMTSSLACNQVVQAQGAPQAIRIFHTRDWYAQHQVCCRPPETSNTTAAR